jgi:hypothetical protein
MLSAHFDEYRSQSALRTAIPFFQRLTRWVPQTNRVVPASLRTAILFPAVDAGHDSRPDASGAYLHSRLPFVSLGYRGFGPNVLLDFRKSQKDLRTMFRVAGLKQHHQPRMSEAIFWLNGLAKGN